MAAGRPGWGCQPAVSGPILGPSITHYEAGACPPAGTGSRRAGHSPLFRGLDWQASLPVLCPPPGHGSPTWDRACTSLSLAFRSPQAQRPHSCRWHVPLPASPTGIPGPASRPASASESCHVFKAERWHLQAWEAGCPPSWASHPHLRAGGGGRGKPLTGGRFDYGGVLHTALAQG